MRRRFLLVPIAAAVALALGAWTSRDGQAPVAGARVVHTVMVTLQCGPGADSVSPYAIRVRRGDDIVWQLTPESDVERYRINRKTPVFGRWPFAERPLDGDRANPPRGNGVKDNADGRYRYKVIGWCRGGDKEVIDPDIIIELD